ncbi:MAG TPA: tetratricopeptide repeat protein [Blastocatellia bacterium]|nr:tetratricopeptide repeat protein [Blastocatellia bacterium]
MGLRRYFPALTPILFVLCLGLPAWGQAADPDKPVDAEQIHRTGVSYYESGEFEKAIEAYRQAIRLRPDSQESYYHLGMAYSSLGRYKEAVEAYNNAIRIKPDYAAAYYNLGHAHSNLNQYGRAIKVFKQALQHDPDNVEIYLALGDAYSDSGDEDKAVAAFEAAIRREPSNPYTYYKLGLFYFPHGPHARAVDAFSQAIIRDPRHAEAYFHRSYAYLFMGRGESAVGDAETYLALKGWRTNQSLYMVIAAYFGHMQIRQEAAARKALGDAVRQADRSEWPYPVIEYLIGEISPRLLLRSASEESQKAEARTYIGLSLSLKGDQKAALDHLKWVKNNTHESSIPFALAMSEIERIEDASSVSLKR